MRRFNVKKFIKNKYFIGAFVIAVIVICFVFCKGDSSLGFEFAKVKTGDVVQKISVTGRILAMNNADLAFGKSGIVAIVNVKVGDHVKKGEVIASLDSSSDRANLASAQAKLDDMTRSLRPEESQVEQSKVDLAKVVLDNAKRDALDAVRAGYAQAMNAVNNYVDNFFTNPQSVNPTVNIYTQSDNEKNSVSLKRIVVSESFVKWKKAIDVTTSTDNVSDLVSQASGYLDRVKDLMDTMSVVISNLNPGNSGLVQSAIDMHVSNMNSGLIALNQAITSVSSARAELESASSSYDQANDNYTLKLAGNSSDSIKAQSASLDSFRAELNKGVIFAPFDGIITRVEPTIGEFASLGQTAFSIIEDNGYKIEAFVPEADIAKINLNDLASTTLDAYGQNVDFPSVVTTIDPAETILEGVPTYKVTLRFIESDSRLRPGMTANLEILTDERSNVLIVPARAVVDDDGSKTVRVLNSDGKTFTPVSVRVGLKGSDGVIEIISGVSEGEEVVTYIK
jgi:multidrug efflux pump subunit AcrA (membrane-fusion protein)